MNLRMTNDKVWVVIFKFSTLTTFKTMVEFDPNPNLKIFYLSNKKFESISSFQMIHCSKHGIKLNVQFLKL